MTKADLKTGMVLVCRDGRRWRFYKDVVTAWTKRDVIVLEDNERCWDYLEIYDDDLNYVLDDFFDDDDLDYARNKEIVQIEVIDHPYAFLHMDYEDEPTVIYTKKKKYTYDELKAILGHDFELSDEAVSCG